MPPGSLLSSRCSHASYGRFASIHPCLFTGESRRIGRWQNPSMAINNQHSHIEEEYVRMQAQLQAAQETEPQRNVAKSSHHVYHDTEVHPYQRQGHRHVHHEPLIGRHSQQDMSHHDVELANAVELSYQYSSNIVNYHMDADQIVYEEQAQYLTFGGRPATPLPRPILHRARVEDYNHPSTLARDIVAVLHGGGKLMLELPDEPAAVSSLLTALGRAATKLQSAGLATALDPVYDPVAVVHGCSTMRQSHAAHNGHANTSTTPSNGNGGSPTSSHDMMAPGTTSAASGNPTPSGNGGGGSTAAAQRRPALPPDGCQFVLCARAVPMPPAASSPSPSSSAAVNGTYTYTVGSSMGQEVLRVGPSAGVHALLPALLRAVLRDGLVTLRCCWFDEDTDSDSWSDEEEGELNDQHHHQYQNTDRHQQHVQHPQYKQCREGLGDTTAAMAAGRPAVPAAAHAADAPGSSAPASSSLDHHHLHPQLQQQQLQHNIAGSLVRVPCVLRAVFKLDRQLRGLDLGGLVLLPHTFARAGPRGTTQVLHLDVVIA